MPSLYELSLDLKKLDNVDFEDIQQEQVEEIKDIIKLEIENKSSNIIALVRNIEVDIEALESEIKRLYAIKKVKENKVKSIRNYIKSCLIECDKKKIETKLGNISIRKNPATLVIDDFSKIDSKFISEELVYKADKQGIKDSIKAGRLVDGCHLENSVSLIIK